jgi:hypothetical protein
MSAAVPSTRKPLDKKRIWIPLVGEGSNAQKKTRKAAQKWS